MSEVQSVQEPPPEQHEHALHLDDGIVLSFSAGVPDGWLFVKGDAAFARRNRWKYHGPTHRTENNSLPFSHILLVEVVKTAGRPDELVITYCYEAASTLLRPNTLKYKVSETKETEAQDWAVILLSDVYKKGKAQVRKRAKVLVNPFAGGGNAVRQFNEDVKPLFVAAQMQLDIVVTERKDQAIEICEALDIDAFDVVVVCSGDGLAYEVFNGFAKRPDARKALQKIAVAHIPCGSGNAMSCNLNGNNFPAPSGLAVIKGIRTPMDLMSLTQGPRRTLSFLSQSVGIIAEADLATENLRWMGHRRFDLGVAIRMISKKTYPCDVAIKVEIEDKKAVKEHYRRMRGGEKSPFVPAEGESNSNAIQPAGDGLPPLRFGTVNDPLPPDWKQESIDKLGNFYCGNMAFMAPNANFFPAAMPNDGLMDLCLNDGDLSVVRYYKLMSSVENNRHYDRADLSYRKISAYRFTPRNQPDGYISIDGERIPFEPFQVEVHPGLGTVLSKHGYYEADGPTNWNQSRVQE
ncbi:sphingoid long chain base kinase-like protein [Astrocystis sublimbata]|nr:sphingoid long chain base kinase-like protein [Astrocystis sublimbata]